MGAPGAIGVLVVDDDAAVSAMIGTFLTKNGYSVRTAPNPIEAEKILASQDIRLLITDLMMPHQDGIRFTQKLREQPKFKDLPIILITAYPSTEIFDKGLRKGVSLALSKPIELKKLLELVGFATQAAPAQMA